MRVSKNVLEQLQTSGSRLIFGSQYPCVSQQKGLSVMLPPERIHRGGRFGESRI